MKHFVTNSTDLETACILNGLFNFVSWKLNRVFFLIFIGLSNKHDNSGTVVIQNICKSWPKLTYIHNIFDLLFYRFDTCTEFTGIECVVRVEANS